MKSRRLDDRSTAWMFAFVVVVFLLSIGVWQTMEVRCTRVCLEDARAGDFYVYAASCWCFDEEGQAFRPRR